MAYKVADGLHYPSAVLIKKVSFGIASDNPDVSLVSSDVSALSTLFKVPVGSVILDFLVHKKTAFGSTGAFTADFGDTDPDGLLESTDAVMSDVGFVSLKSWRGSTGAIITLGYMAGKIISTGDTLDSDNNASIGVTIGTAPINAGLADAYLVYFQGKSA